MAGTPGDRLEGRNGTIWRDYIRKNMTQDEIAEKHGISQQRVSQIISQVRSSIGAEKKTDIVDEEVGWLRDVRAQLTAIMDQLPPVVTAGKDGEIVIDPESGQPVRDMSGHIRASEAALKMSARLHALLGLDASVKVDVNLGAQAAMEEAAADALRRLADAAGE